jgi:hypothetical protein
MYAWYINLAILIAGVILVIGGYIYEEKLRTVYHWNRPEAIAISGAVIAFLALLGFLQQKELKKGSIFGFLYLGDIMSNIFNFIT